MFVLRALRFIDLNDDILFSPTVILYETEDICRYKIIAV